MPNASRCWPRPNGRPRLQEFRGKARKSWLSSRKSLANWQENPTEQDQQREANVGELLNAAAQYDSVERDHPSLEGFLETTALVSDIDSVDQAAERVTLM